jgi:hypothetical protein
LAGLLVGMLKYICPEEKARYLKLENMISGTDSCVEE